MLSKVAYGQAAKSAFLNMFGFLGFLCLIVNVPASADLRRDLPIGYQEITEVSPGQYRVLARCVQTSALLESVAEKTGKPLVFDVPCNTYVSILHPKKIASLESWLDYIAGMGGSLHCRLRDDGAWHVFQLSINPVYKPELSETEVINTYRSNMRPSPGASSGIPRGLVFHYGVLLLPPYSISPISNDSGETDITINGVSVRWISKAAPRNQKREAPEFPSSGQFEDTQQLCDYVTLRLYPEFLSSASPEEARDAVIEFLKTQLLVEVVLTDEPLGTVNIEVQFRGQPWRSDIFPVNYDYDLGCIQSVDEDTTVGSHEIIQSSVNQITSLLSKDVLLFYSKTGQLVMPGGLAAQLAECMKIARDLPLLQAECILEELVEDRALARDLAVNLSGNYGEAIAQVEAVQRRRDDLRDSESSSVGDGAGIRDVSPGLILGSVWCLASCTWRKVGTKV